MVDSKIYELSTLLDSSDEILKQGILKSIKDLEAQEVGTGLGKWTTMLSGSTPEWMTVKLLKAIIDQNKIIIRQNELLLRAIIKYNKD